MSEIIKKDPHNKQKITISQIKEEYKYRLYVMWEEHILFDEERDYKFLIAFRDSVVPAMTWGRGVIWRLLPVIRRVNKVQEFLLRNAAINISGVFTANDSGSFNPHTVRIVPGAIIPVDSNDNNNPTLRALDRIGDAGLAQFTIEEMQMAIEKAMYINPLGDITDPTKTATEMMIRQQEQLKNEGAGDPRS